MTSRIAGRWPLVVAAAALLAHGGCLGSVFYLDDWTQIVESDLVDQGVWYSVPQRALTYLTYCLTYRVFGLSPVAFHAGNLLLHAAVSLALLGFAREYLTVAAHLSPERARRVAGWGALLFAVHPLCSEMPNYTRARDIGLVSLFALLSAWATLRWRRDGTLRWLGAACAAAVAATFCKEVGLPLATGTALLTALGTGRRSREETATPIPARTGGRGRGRWRTALFAAGALVVVGSLGYAGGLVSLLFRVARQSLGAPRMGWHVLTEARVFWMYLARVAWPARLCSDHQIAWTISAGDAVARVAAAGELAVAAASVVALCQRRRPAVRAAGALAAVALLDIVHRLANVSAELMVEYRMYPAMLPICVLLAWGLDGLLAFVETRRRLPPAVGRIAFGGIVAACLLTSARRTLDWHSLDALVANVVAQYPANARAFQELQEADIRAGHWESVVARQTSIRQAFDEATAYNSSHSLRKYDPEHLTMTRIISEGKRGPGPRAAGQAGGGLCPTDVAPHGHGQQRFHAPRISGVRIIMRARWYTTPSASARTRWMTCGSARNSTVGPFGYPPRQLRRYQRGEPLP